MTVPAACVRAGHPSVHRPTFTQLRPLVLGVIGILSVFSLQPAPALADSAQAATAPTPAALRVIVAARTHIGAAYRAGTDGPRTFDCSGLVFRAFKEAGEAHVLGGVRRTAAGYQHRFEAQGQASRRGGQPGDLVIYARGGHIGIYLGHGKVISALTSGVKVHGLRRLNIPFTEFLHTHLSHSTGPAGATKVMRTVSRPAPVRSRPQFGAHRVDRVYRGTLLRVVGHHRDRGGHPWLRVSLPDGETGWIRKAFTLPV